MNHAGIVCFLINKPIYSNEDIGTNDGDDDDDNNVQVKVSWIL